jgi:hypothetical protein
MATHTLPHPSLAPKAHYAHLDGSSGILCKIGADILFMSYDTGAIVTVTSYRGLTVLGEGGIADCQAVLDRLAGGYAAIACNRSQMEVR